MHELAIADAVVKIVCAHAGDRHVTAVDLKVGHLRQVVPSALAFAFELVAAGTVAEGAELRVHEVAVVGRCRDCDTESTLDAFPLRCPRCGSWDPELVHGEELLVDSLEVQEAALTMNGGQRHGD